MYALESIKNAIYKLLFIYVLYVVYIYVVFKKYYDINNASKINRQFLTARSREVHLNCKQYLLC